MKKLVVLLLLVFIATGVFAAPWDFLRPYIDTAIELALPIGIIVFLVSLVLLAIASMAMGKTKSEKLRWVFLAFGLFSVKLLINVIDLLFSPGMFMSVPIQNIFDLAILASLFIAIFRK